MENNVIRASSKSNKFEIVLSQDGGVLPPLVQPATQKEESAYRIAGEAIARGSFEEAKTILQAAGFTILENN